MRTERSLARSLSVGLALLGAAGCGGQSASHVSLHPSVGEIPAGLRADYDVFASNCNKCHDLERALTAPVTDNRHWELYVAKMMRTPGSGISAGEAPHILRFLFWYTDRKNGRPTSFDPVAPETSAAEVREVPEANPQPRAPEPVPMAPLPAAPAETATETEGESTP